MRKDVSARWLIPEKICSVMKQHQLTYEKWARMLGISMQRLHANVWGKHRGKTTQEMILGSLELLTGKPATDFYKEEG